MLEQGWSYAIGSRKGHHKISQKSESMVPRIKFFIGTDLFKKASGVIETSFHLSDFELHQKSLEHQKHHPTRIPYFGLDLSANLPVQRTWHLTTKQKNKGSRFLPRQPQRNLPHHRSDTVGFSSGISDMDLERFKIYNPVFQPGWRSFSSLQYSTRSGKELTEETRSNVALRFSPQNQYTTKIYEENMKSSIIYSTRRVI